MENIETVRLAASVLERLAIYDQVRLATLCRKGEKFDEELLTAMGKITGGSELVRRVGARLAIGELALALNYADGGTGSRVLEELERVDPATLKQVRGGMLFIEDLLLLEDAHIRRVLEETEEEELACALKGVEAAVQDAVYRNLPGPAVAKLRERMELMGPVPFGKVMESHWAIVATMRRLAETGEIVMPGRGQART